ncbi:hypothetical protein KY289_026375 [Solanum tuberosum]|nr:hypothetical protein KY289_026375 [Solanum tuberosum]
MLTLEEAGRAKKAAHSSSLAMVARESIGSHDIVDHSSSHRNTNGGKRNQYRNNNRNNNGGRGGNKGGSGGGGKVGGGGQMGIVTTAVVDSSHQVSIRQPILHGLEVSRGLGWHRGLPGLYLLIYICQTHGQDPIMDSSLVYLGLDRSRPTRQLQLQPTLKLQCILLESLLRMQIGTWISVPLLIWHPHKDFRTGRPVMRCESRGELYPITTPVTSPSTFAALAPSLWDDRLGHPRALVLNSLRKNKLIECNQIKDTRICHSFPLGKHVKLPFYP